MKSYLPEKKSSRKGFLLYIIIVVLLLLAVMAFALNTLKSGAVVQLAKNVDQNRLTLLAQSANAEVIAMIRSSVNQDSSSEIFKRFRAVFPDFDELDASLNERVVLFTNVVVPEKTLEMAENIGYKLKIKSKAILTSYREATANSVQAYNAYLDVYSQAYREGKEANMIEIHERCDVRMVDLRHRFDQYALFVKQYSPDYNNPNRRIIVEGIPDSEPHLSHIYLGNFNYPDCADPKKYFWLDAFNSETLQLSGFVGLTGFSGFSNDHFENAPACLLSEHKTPFKDIVGPQKEQFYKVQTVIDVYETYVNEAANGCLGTVTPFETGSDLKDKCAGAMGSANPNAAAYKICEDFVNNYSSAGGGDYSACNGFDQILTTCILEWPYVYGYTDAASIWNVDDAVRPQLPSPRAWVNALAYGGLASTTTQYRKKGPFFAEFLDKKVVDGSEEYYNPERIRVGKMAQLWGVNFDKKVLVEGPVMLRYFKLAYFDTFSKTITFGSQEKDLEPEPVPLNFYRYDKTPETFLNARLGNALPTLGVLEEDYLMSRDVASFPINSLMGSTISYIDGDGNEATLNPYSTIGYPNFSNPLQPSGYNVSGIKFGRRIDFKTVSWNYPNTAAFVAERVRDVDGTNTLFVDGVMYIEEGDLDLSTVEEFYGKGMIYLGKGNCLLGNFKRIKDRDEDSIRFYLRQGDFIIKSAANDIYIEASLAALYYPFGSADPLQQGSLIINGRHEVTIYGNLLVDYIYTESSDGSGLVDGGKLTIMHDPVIYDPAATVGTNKLDPYHVSIGPVKTIFSINAGGKTF
ncbi:MAG: hypothetical protein ACQETH_01590 [Candidatus Rifleibacteriota bacterium]